MALDTIVGNLGAYQRLEKGTFRSTSDILNEARKNGDFSRKLFYTPQGNGYFVIEGTVQWVITNEDDNLVLQHLDDAFAQLTKDGNYKPQTSEALAVRRSSSTLIVDMKKLRLSGTDKECGDDSRYLAINPRTGFIKTANGYEVQNEEEQKVMERLGYTPQNLLMLDRERVKELRVYVLNPSYVLKQVEKDPQKRSLWRASWFGTFGNVSYASASCRRVDFVGALQGSASAKKSADVVGKKDRNFRASPRQIIHSLLAPALNKLLPNIT